MQGLLPLMLDVSSAHPIPAIHIVGLCDDVVGLRCGQKNGHASKVLSPAHSTKGNSRADFSLFLARCLIFIFREERIDTVPMLPINDTGCNRVDVDAMLYQIKLND
jgi:hypothetical protein